MNVSKRAISKIAVFALLISVLSGCLLAPTIESVKKAGFTEGDREAIFATDLQSMIDDMRWGKANLVIDRVQADVQPTLAPKIRAFLRKKKIVDLTIDNVVWQDDAYSATVDLVVKSYDPAVSIIDESPMHMEWIFSLVDGWKLVDMKPQGPAQG